MPSLETHDRNQDAVVQLAGEGILAEPDSFGNVKVAAAKQLKGGVRWEDVKREVTDAFGNNVSISADVVVAEDIPVGSVMWKGLIGSHVSTVTKYKVVQKGEMTDLKGRNTRRTVALMKLGDTAPEESS